MKNVFFNSLTNIWLSTIFNKISKYIPYLGHLFFVILHFVNFPSLSVLLSFPKVIIINSLMFHLIIGHCLDQWFPTEAEQTLRDRLKICKDIFWLSQ